MNPTTYIIIFGVAITAFVYLLFACFLHRRGEGPAWDWPWNPNIKP